MIYVVEVNFDGMIGYTKTYRVEADSESEAREIALQVVQARNEKKLSQEQLANKVHENIAAIKDLENCQGQYNPKLVEKIERTLGVKFDRSWKK